MGFWNTAADGTSFAGDGTMLWGDAPADVMGDGVELYRSKNPGVSDADLIREFREGTFFDKVKAEAGLEFSDGVGRLPTEGELLAGLGFYLGVDPR